MFSSHRMMNFFKKCDLPILNSVFISGARPLSGKVSTHYILGKKSTQANFHLFTRGLSHFDEWKSANSKEAHVTMRGLPFSATKKDIINFFRPLNIEPIDITLESNNYGQPSGFASVTFRSYSDAVKSLKKHRSYMGRRYIELHLKDQLGSQYLQEDRSAYMGDKSPSQSLQADPSACMEDKSQSQSLQADPSAYIPTEGHRVVLKGLPYEATVNDVINFFAPLNIKPSHVEMKLGYLDRATGICDCIFESREDALTALKNHRAFMGRRWIEVLMSSGLRPNFGESGNIERHSDDA